MRNEKNIGQLTKQLQSLGFGDGLEIDLRSQICFQPACFDIPYRIIKDADVVNFKVHLETGEAGEYTSLYYDASLRKELQLDGSVLSDPNIAQLQMNMAAIDWGTSTKKDWKISVEMANQIEEVICGLQLLSITEEEKMFAGLLKFKYWSDSSVEDLIPSFNYFKSQYEITQRFYIFEGQGISTDEAYRFLCNRWLERKMQSRRKQPGKGNDGDAATSGNTPYGGSLSKKGQQKSGKQKSKA